MRSEFYAATQQWKKIAEQQRQDALAVSAKEPKPQVFRAGEPIDRNQEAYVHRLGVMSEFDRQVMTAHGCPGIILYGRRRMGKSTLLKNLSGFLPDSIRIADISMQDARAFASLGDFLQSLTKEIQKILHGFDLPNNSPIDLVGFIQYLELCNDRLKEKNLRLLLAFDEYESIDKKIGEKVFPEDLLATMRESIQNHRHLTWVFAGSNHISELEHAPWASYLISARTVEIPPFTESETHLLLTEPLKHSTFLKADDPKRPRFDPAFWGENGIQRIHAEAGGWPNLVQLIAETIVNIINDEGADRVDNDLYERSLDKAIVSGDAPIREIMANECKIPGEWDYLAGFRQSDSQPPPDDEKIYQSLRRRLLVKESDNEWRLRVPLMQRWLRQRG